MFLLQYSLSGRAAFGVNEEVLMTEEVKPAVQRVDRESSTGSSLGTFFAVILLLAAVVGGAWYINQDPAEQASIGQSDNAATGVSTGESGSQATSQSVNAPETPDMTPRSEPKQQP